MWRAVFNNLNPFSWLRESRRRQEEERTYWRREYDKLDQEARARAYWQGRLNFTPDKVKKWKVVVEGPFSPTASVLLDAGFDVQAVEGVCELPRIVNEHKPDFVILTNRYQMEGPQSLEIVRLVEEAAGSCHIVLVGPLNPSYSEDFYGQLGSISKQPSEMLMTMDCFDPQDEASCNSFLNHIYAFIRGPS